MVLATKRPGALLPTVRSRLHQLEGAVDSLEKEGPEVVPDLASLKEELGRARDRAALISCLETIRTTVKPRLLLQPSTAVIKAIELLDRSIRRLSQNVNQKLVVDALLLNWPL
jgi:hypothetical protein